MSATKRKSTDDCDDLQPSRHECATVTPTLEFMLNNCHILNEVTCTVVHCNAKFSNKSALHLHLTKVHKLSLLDTCGDQCESLALECDPKLKTITRSKAQKLSDKCTCKYYCPAGKCKYNRAMGDGRRSLPTYHSLKVHFIRMHGDKQFKCGKCARDFSIKSEMVRHEERCSQMYRCSCDCPFTTITSLVKHAQINCHLIPPYSQMAKFSAASEIISAPKMTPANQQQLSEEARTKARYRPIYCASMMPAPQIFIINNVVSQNQVGMMSSLAAAGQPPEPKRSLGCQTALHESAQTQTFSESIFGDFNCLDAATSPLNIDSVALNDALASYDIYSAEMSTQTSLTAFGNSAPAASILSEHNSMTALYSFDAVNRESQTSQSVHTTATFTQTRANLASMCFDPFPGGSNTMETQTSTAYWNGASEPKRSSLNNSRCNTPVLGVALQSTSTQCAANQQAHGLAIETNSIQTQTLDDIIFANLVDNITQTPWDYKINDFLI